MRSGKCAPRASISASFLEQVEYAIRLHCLCLTCNDTCRLDTANDTVEMFVHFPPGFEEMAAIGLKYPTILWIHGGPVSQYTYQWSSTQHMCVFICCVATTIAILRSISVASRFAAAGYVVLSVNPRGSTGRGQEYCEALFADWGGPALRDVLSAVKFAICETKLLQQAHSYMTRKSQTESMCCHGLIWVGQGWSDPARLCVGGWSYGGMLTDHVITSSRDVLGGLNFKAAITGASAVLYRGVAATLSALLRSLLCAHLFTLCLWLTARAVLCRAASYGHDQYQLLWEQELGLPWEHAETWEAISPFNKVANVTTPTLIMCGEKDWNVPVQNSDQLYIALKRLGVETSLVVYPDQHHWVSSPSMEADIYERWLDWFGRHTS